MADERVTIEIRGIDRASGVIRKIGGALGQIAVIAGGIIAAGLFRRLADGLVRIGKAAITAFEWFDRIRFALGELARADILDGLDRAVLTTEDWANVAKEAADSAQNLLKWIIDLALASPFTAEDVNKLFRLTRAYGFATDEAQSLTGQILDFAVATGFGSQVLERMGLALGQVRQRGRLAGEEIRQLINVGIPVRDIVAKAFEVTTEELEKMIRAGKVAADVALPAILEWLQRFDGASARAVVTWHGLVANMKDVIDLNLIAVFDGIAKVLVPGLQSVFDILSSAQFRDGMTALGKGIGTWLGTFIDKIPALVSGFQTMGALIRGFGAGQISLGTGLAKFLEIIGLIEVANMPAIRAAIDGVALAIGAFAANLRIMAENWIGPIKDDFPKWLQDIEAIGTTTIEMIDEAFTNIAIAVKQMGDENASTIIRDFTEGLDSISTWWTEKGAEPAGQILEFLGVLISGGVIGGLAILAATIGVLGDVLAGKDPLPRLKDLFETFQNLATTLAGTDIFESFATSVAQLLILGTNKVTPTADTEGGKAGEAYVMGLTNALQVNEEAIAGEIVRITEATTEQGGSWMEKDGEQRLGIAAAAMAQGLGDGFTAQMLIEEKRIRAILERIVAMVNSIYGVESPSTVMAEVGANLMAGLGQGIEDGARDAIKAITKATDQIVDAAKAELQIASPSEVLSDIGRQAMAGLGQGITQAAASPAAALATATPSVPAVGGGGAQQPIINYQPAISLADEREVRTRISPVLARMIELSETYRQTGRTSIRSRDIYAI